MSHYRAPPPVLPSLRPIVEETAAVIRDAVPDPIERGFLRWARRLDEYPFVAAALDEATREHAARERAASAPCPPSHHRGMSISGPLSPDFGPILPMHA